MNSYLSQIQSFNPEGAIGILLTFVTSTLLAYLLFYTVTYRLSSNTIVSSATDLISAANVPSIPYESIIDTSSKSKDAIHTQGLRLSYIANDFYAAHGGIDAFEGLTTSEVCEKFIQPMTKHTQNSLCDLLASNTHSDIGPAQVYVSHAWGCTFTDVIDALLYHFRSNPHVIIWMDIFSINQIFFPSLEKELFNKLEEIIESIGHTVLITAQWKLHIPLYRTWCLYEIYCSIITNCKFELIMSASHKQVFLVDICKDPQGELDKLMVAINIQNSLSFKLEDHSQILGILENRIGFSGFNTIVCHRIRDWIIEKLQHEIVIENQKGNIHELKYISLHHALGSLLVQQGKYDIAEGILQLCLKMITKKFGDDHSDALVCMKNLAHLYDKQENYDFAEIMYSKYFEKSKVVMGDDHPDTLTCMNNLALVYNNLGHYDLAENMHRSCSDKRLSAFGLDHPDTLTSMNNLARVYFNQGKFDMAEDMHGKCLERRRLVLGDDHPDTLVISTMNLADVYTSQGKYDLAEEIISKCVDRCRVVLGEDHPDTVTCMYSLAGVYGRQSKYTQAEDLYSICFEKCFTILGDDHPDSLSSMNSLARILYDSDENKLLIADDM